MNFVDELCPTRIHTGMTRWEKASRPGHCHLGSVCHRGDSNQSVSVDQVVGEGSTPVSIPGLGSPAMGLCQRDEMVDIQQ